MALVSTLAGRLANAGGAVDVSQSVPCGRFECREGATRKSDAGLGWFAPGVFGTTSRKSHRNRGMVVTARMQPKTSSTSDGLLMNRKPSEAEQYFFLTEPDTTVTRHLSAAHYVPEVIGVGAILGAALVLSKILNASRSLSLLSGFRPDALARILGITGEKSLSHQPTARPNEYSREFLQAIREVDAAGLQIEDEGYIFFTEGLAFERSAETASLADSTTAASVRAVTQVSATTIFLQSLGLMGDTADETTKESGVPAEGSHATGIMTLRQLRSEESADSVDSKYGKGEFVFSQTAA